MEFVALSSSVLNRQQRKRMQTNRESARRLSMRKQKHLDDLMAEIENLSKQLKDTFNSSVLHETIMQILETFMSTGKPHPWVDYLMPKDARFPGLTASSSNNNLILSDVTKFDQLMTEAQTVLSSDEFTNVVEVSLKTVASAVVQDVCNHPSGASTGTPLVKLVPRVAQVSQLILDEPSENQFIQLIRNIHDVELFFTILYTNTTAV